MKRRNKEKLNQALDLIKAALEDDSTVGDLPRVGDPGTPLSIKSVINDESKRTVVIVWEDGKVTKSVADPADEYDFTTGFGLCIAKKMVNNLENYATAIQKSKRYIHIPKDKE